MIFLAILKPMAFRGFLRTAETVAIEAAAAGIVTYAVVQEAKDLLRTK
jgi:hypothetical protein